MLERGSMWKAALRHLKWYSKEVHHEVFWASGSFFSSSRDNEGLGRGAAKQWRHRRGCWEGAEPWDGPACHIVLGGLAFS